MWPSQTYLSALGSGAGIKIYLLWEDYTNDEVSQKNRFIDALSRFAHAQGHNADIFIPLAGAEDHITRELATVYEKRWWDLKDHLPAFLVLDKLLRDFDPRRDAGVLLTIPENAISEQEECSKFLKGLEREMAKIAKAAQGKNLSSVRVLQAIYDAADLKFTIFGSGVDFKKLGANLKGLVLPTRR